MSSKKAFTLIELLVVIAIIALLLAILMPSLRKAKQVAQAVVCSAHTKQLSLAWQLYANDYDGRMCNGNNNKAGPYGSDVWVHPIAQPADPGYEAGMDVIAREIVGIQHGALYPYSGKEGIYHCPADPTFKEYRGEMSLPNDKISPYRTFAIAAGMNGGDKFGVIALRKITQLRNASGKYVFVEEADGGADDHNYASWAMYPDPSVDTWWDPLSTWHGMKSVFGFADGHAETHKWRNESTNDLANGKLGPGQAFAGGKEDLRWAQQGYIRN